MRFGADLEHEPGTGFWGYCDPACTSGLLARVSARPGPARSVDYRFRLNNLPQHASPPTADLLSLPLAGAMLGMGDPSQPPPYNLEQGESEQPLPFLRAG